MTTDTRAQEPGTQDVAHYPPSMPTLDDAVAAHTRMQHHLGEAARAQNDRDATVLALVQSGTRRREIADALNMSAPGVRFMVQRARARDRD